MARMLSRSRSLRMLRGGHKEPHQQDSGHSTPLPSDSQVDFDRLKATSPVTRTDRRVETPDMVPRPKTSGGLGDRGKLFHKKVAHLEPEDSSSTSNLSFPSPAKSATSILYAAEFHEDREGIIGIALGSPTMNPAWNNSPNRTALGTVTHITSNATPQAPVDVKHETPKPKLSRWKSIFGKKAAHPQPQKPSFYQLVQSAAPPRADSHHDDESLASRSISRAEDIPIPQEIRSPSPPVFRPDIRESRRLPKGQEQPLVESRPRALTAATSSPSKPKFSLMRSASSPKVLQNSNLSHPPIPQVVVSESPRNVSSPLSNNGGPLLDIDIPNIKLDRYSVMFGNVLQSNSNSASNRSSSLLARRQGNTERLKPLNELSVKKEDGTRVKPQRRATSPSYPKSPSFALSLFPQQPVNKTPSSRPASSHRPRPLQRSKTAPPNSPSRQSFPLQQSSNDGANEVSQVETSRDLPENDDLNLKPHLLSPALSSRHSFDSVSSIIIVDESPIEPWRPRMGEPSWEVVTKPSPLTALRSHPTNPSRAALDAGPSSAPIGSQIIQDPTTTNNTTKTHPTAAAHPVPRSADRTAKHQQSHTTSHTPTIGVARSISVSRASPRSASVKPTLVRSRTAACGTATAASDKSIISPASFTFFDKNSLSPGSGRFIDQKPMTPTLVELAGNRKSHVVLLEDA